MKKMISLWTAILLMITITVSAKDDVEVNELVRTAFQKDFHHTTSVSWKRSGEIYIASFDQFDGSHMAYYNAIGDLLGTSQLVNVKDMPVMVSETIKRRFKGYRVQQVLKYFSATEGLSYFVQLSGPNNEVVSIDREGTIQFIHKTK